MNRLTFRTSLLRAARKDRPSRESAERVLAAALLISLETCTAPKRRLRSHDLLRNLLLPMAVLSLAGDPSPPFRSPSTAPSPVKVVARPPPPVPAVPTPTPVPVPVALLSPPLQLAPPPRAPSELSLLRRARAALPANPALALSALTTHARLYPRGLLLEEAEALRVDALFASNDLPATRVAAARFLAAHPASPYTQRIRNVATHAAAAHDD